MRNGRLIIAALVMVLVTGPVAADDTPLDYIQAVSGGDVNWRTGKATAAGFSEPAQKKSSLQAVRKETLSAARQLATETLESLIGSLRLSGRRTVADAMAADPSIAEKIGEMVRSAPVVQQNFLSDGAAEVVVEMNLYGGFAQLILPADIRPIEAIQPVNAQKDAPGTPAKAAAGSGPAGGLIIDARGLKAAPAMMFSVLDENGKPVYGSAYVSREYAVQWGMAAYVRRMPRGNDLPRVTPAPLVIKGLRAVGDGRGDIVISNADAVRLKGAVENLILLRQGKVAVVID